MKKYITDSLLKLKNGYSICGLIDKKQRIYPLGTDTKVLSTIFEIVTKQIVCRYAKDNSFIVEEPLQQNFYPDFTLSTSKEDTKKIAIDIKTTYRGNKSKFSYTLGSYTSFIKENTETKNILYPFSHYKKHWVIGFVYDKFITTNNIDTKIYRIEELEKIILPFDNVDFFIQEKWKIAGDKAGSGNTANIGSIKGIIEDFRNGKSVFKNEKEFLTYWRGYKKTKIERNKYYSNISEFRKFKTKKDF